MSHQKPIRRKLVIVGDGACGKTALLSTFAHKKFPGQYYPHIFESYVADLQIDDKLVQLALWDTDTREEYERLRPLSYHKAHVILIAFALDNPTSLENVSTKWIEEVRAFNVPMVPVVLVGCKADLRGEGEGEGGVERAQAERVAGTIGACAYMECSALRVEGVDAVFEEAVRASVSVREDGCVGKCCVVC